MGYAVGYDSTWNRDIGYGVPAVCDSPKCNEEIDRGLSYVCCGEQPYGGEHGCGLYFCEAHRRHDGKCSRCANRRKTPYAAKSDTVEWMRHKLTDPSWERWRVETPAEVETLRARILAAERPVEKRMGKHVWRQIVSHRRHYNPGYEKHQAVGGTYRCTLECGHEVSRKLSAGLPAGNRMSCHSCAILRVGAKATWTLGNGWKCEETWDAKTGMPAKRMFKPEADA